MSTIIVLIALWIGNINPAPMPDAGLGTWGHGHEGHEPL